MKISIRGFLLDMLAFQGLSKQRQKRIARASAEPMPIHPVNQLVQQIHPDRMRLVIDSVKDETRSTRTFRLVADRASGSTPLPPFRAGQYLSLKVAANGVRITRPFSISSAPYEARGPNGFYEITVKRVADGFLTPYLWENWKAGTAIESGSPAGFFYHESLRDSRHIVGLAGGSGVTPFRSMAREIVHGGLDAQLVLLFGSSAEDDILFYDEFKALEQQSGGRVRIVHVLSCEQVTLPGCESGFITADLIRKHGDLDDATIFVCGPQVMYEFVRGELAKLGLPHRRVRWEAFGEVKNVARHPAFPSQAVGATYQVKAQVNGESADIPARSTETVLVALERAGLEPPSQCRSGECGYCRSLLLSGDIFVLPEGDGRRGADREFGHFHPCSSYPLSDLVVRVPRTA